MIKKYHTIKKILQQISLAALIILNTNGSFGATTCYYDNNGCNRNVGYRWSTVRYGSVINSGTYSVFEDDGRIRDGFIINITSSSMASLIVGGQYAFGILQHMRTGL